MKNRVFKIRKQIKEWEAKLSNPNMTNGERAWVLERIADLKEQLNE